MEDKIYQQMTLWECIYPRKVIDKPIRLIELFAGIGAQHKALKQLTNQVESWKICEWAYNSYCSYNAIHIKDFTDYSIGLSKEELIKKVRGTSTNYNEPLTDKQLKQKPIEWLRNAYNNIKATHNLINIMEVHGKDLEIVDTDKYEYIMTYSFPCQDLSLAGKRQGMSTSQKEGGTRSGLLWEVERILGELVRGGLSLPQILVMENVPEVIGSGNVQVFNKWEQKLRELGYTNYVEILNAKNYGIPQNRKRCFMVSILGEYAYDFPCKMKLKYKLKDLLEKEVDEKYYLSQKMINCFMSDGTGNYPRRERFLQNIGRDNQEVGNSLTTLAGSRPTDNFVVEKFGNKALDETLEENVVEDGDGIDISTRMEWHRGTVQKGQAQTLTTKGGENVGVVVDEEPSLFTECDIALITPEGDIRRYIGSDIIDKFEEGQMATTSYPNGYGHGTRTHNDSITLTKGERPIVKQNLRIRKLTPKECMRLMGFTDDDYKSVRKIGMTDSAIYHMAGDSIVVPVLIGIFSQLVNEDDKHKKIINEYIKKGIKL